MISMKLIRQAGLYIPNYHLFYRYRLYTINIWWIKFIKTFTNHFTYIHLNWIEDFEFYVFILQKNLNNSSSILWHGYNYSEFYSKTLHHVYKHRLGTSLTKSHDVHERPLRHDYDTSQASFNFRSNPLRHFTIRDQGECGASFAFSTLGKLQMLNGKVLIISCFN